MLSSAFSSLLESESLESSLPSLLLLVETLRLLFFRLTNFCFFCPLPEELFPRFPPLLWLSELLLSLSLPLRLEKYDEVSELDSLLLLFRVFALTGDTESVCWVDLPSLGVVAIAAVGAVVAAATVVTGGTGLSAGGMGVDDLPRFSTSLADEPGRFDPPPPDGDGVGVELD